ncbi:MAG: hypothetical protein R2786_11560 [Flavobacteriaceae bacterium]
MKAFIISLFLCSSSYFLSQETTQAILTPNTPWVKEIISFPTPWAPKLTVQGFEELRFAPGWKNPKSDAFWTLVMSWNIDSEEPITAKTIEHYLESYYDGLMTPNHWATTFPPPNALFQESTTANQYQGKIKLFDGFHTGAMMTMHVLAEVTYCPNIQRSILLFRISTQEVGTPIWEQLQAITVLPTVCE